jgi:large subunit ribosomal protein L15e
MAVYKRIAELWKNPRKNMLASYRKYLQEWRKEPATIRIERPTRLDRARMLGYKPIQGIILIRQRLIAGSHKRPNITGGRRPKTQRQTLILRKNYQLIAEERVSRKYKNCEVLNSYEVGNDGKHYWFEIILAERNHPNIRKDKRYAKAAEKRGRAHRGLTSAGRKIRGLRTKGKGAEKARPSRRANLRRL